MYPLLIPWASSWVLAQENSCLALPCHGLGLKFMPRLALPWSWLKVHASPCLAMVLAQSSCLALPCHGLGSRQFMPRLALPWSWLKKVHVSASPWPLLEKLYALPWLYGCMSCLCLETCIKLNCLGLDLVAYEI
jgi:hypothetical protein